MLFSGQVLKQVSLGTCFQMGAAAAIAAVTSFNVACPAPPAKSPLPRPLVSKLSSVTQRTELASFTALTPKPMPTMPLKPTPNCAKEACMALTFDDGPDPRLTPKLLDILAEHQVKATFFVLGSQVAKYPELARRIEMEGHEIGNHSWAHQDFTKMKPAHMLQDIDQTQDAFRAAGVAPATLFRPPYGASNDKVHRAVPLKFVLWNIDPEDWQSHKPADLTAHIVAFAKPQGIVVLHDIKPSTVTAAPEFIAKLKKKYHLVTASRLPGQKTAPHTTEIADASQ